MGLITLARVYDSAEAGDERRFLVERLRPRGIRRKDLRLTDRLPKVGPGHELRNWFGHEPQRWQEVKRRYFAELDGHPQARQPLREATAAGAVTLLYSSRDVEHNNAVVLREDVTSRLDEVASR